LKSLIQRMPFLCLDSFGSFAAEAGMEDIKVVSGNLRIEIVTVEFAVTKPHITNIKGRPYMIRYSFGTFMRFVLELSFVFCCCCFLIVILLNKTSFY
jgi:hypothetical protein